MLGENIRRQRVLRALKQAYIAAQVGLTQSGYSRIERGESDPPYSTVEKIAKAIGCSIHDIVSDGTGPSRKVTPRN